MDPIVPQPSPAPTPTIPVRHLIHTPAHSLPRLPPERRWLIEGLWREAGVGLIGGEPKCCKTILAIDMAIAVASGKPCLRHYPVPRAGPALLFLAEDLAEEVRERMEEACQVIGVSLADLPIEVITEHRLHLDSDEDRQALELVVGQIKPRMLVLDPFVRLHRGMNENSSGAVAPVLGYLRQVQRQYGTAVVLIHHSRKLSGHVRDGQALRGSSDFHAWGDSNLYLRRAPHSQTRIWLATEHRAAPSVSGIELEEVKTTDRPSTLRWVDPATSEAEPKTEAERPESAAREEALIDILAAADGPLTITAIREQSHLRNATVKELLERLRRQNRVRCRSGLWRLPAVGTA